MSTVVKVADLVSNPYRNMDKYPIDRDKLEELKRSYASTGVWPTVVCRKVGREYELAFGHHRWIAAEESGIRSIPVNVLKLTNEEMLKMMADENSSDYRSNSSIDQESIRAVLQAYADGEIDLGKLVPKDANKSTQLEAPSVLGTNAAPSKGPRYTKLSVAKFLGWVRLHKTSNRVNKIEPTHRFNVAWRALEIMEQGIVKEEDYEGLSRKQTDVVSQEASREYKKWDREQKLYEAEAKQNERLVESAKTEPQRQAAKERATRSKQEAKKASTTKKKQAAKITKHVAGKLRKGAGVLDAPALAKEVSKPTKKNIPNVSDLANQVSSRISKMLAAKDKTVAEIDLIVQYRNDCSTEALKVLIANLGSLSTRCGVQKAKLSKSPSKKKQLYLK